MFDVRLPPDPGPIWSYGPELTLAILDDHLAVLAASTAEQVHRLAEMIRRHEDDLKPWRFVLLPHSLATVDFRSDPALAEDVERLRERLVAALEEKP